MSTKNNILTIALYSFAIAAALGLNDLVNTIFDSYKFKSVITSKIVYVTVMFIITLFLAYYSKSTIPI